MPIRMFQVNPLPVRFPMTINGYGIFKVPLLEIGKRLLEEAELIHSL